jgi:hypothetical protein
MHTCLTHTCITRTVQRQRCGMVSVCRLASGDADGGVVVWDVSTASPAARLEDVPTAAEVMRDYRSRNSSDGGPGGSGSLFPQPTSTGTAGGSAAAAAAAAAVGVAPGSGVSSLAWVMPGSCVLAVVLAPALLLLWDVSSEWPWLGSTGAGRVLPAVPLRPHVAHLYCLQQLWGMCCLQHHNKCTFQALLGHILPAVSSPSPPPPHLAPPPHPTSPHPTPAPLLAAPPRPPSPLPCTQVVPC